MKTTNIKISRKLPDGHTQNLGKFTFFDGDSFSIYHDAVVDSGIKNSPLKFWSGFRVKVKGKKVSIHKIMPPKEQDQLIGVGQSCFFDFGNIGKYKITILSL